MADLEISFDENFSIAETQNPKAARDAEADSPLYVTWESRDNWTINQNWLWHETWAWDLDIQETLNVVEKCKKDVSPNFKQTLNVVDRRPDFDFTLNQIQSLGVSDNIDRSLQFYRRFEETVDILEKPSKQYDAAYSDSFVLYDTLVRGAQGVISDLLFEEGGWDLETMQTYMLKGKHVGYENFKPFVAGDYTYEKALFRSVFNATGADRAMLEQFQVTVDVPDLVDRGSAEVTDKNFDLTIEFNKAFHIAPEVTISMRSGVSGKPVIPEVVNVTEENFTMHLIDAFTGERTEGVFIWTAVGY